MAPPPNYNAETLMRVAQKAGITHPTEVAMFAAQMRHESGNFKYDKEIGDDAYFSKYNGRDDLGNTEPGDGPKFCGRGFIQLTGRANYEHFGKKIGVDLINHPEKAQEPDIAARIAVEYWKERVDSKAAQAGDVDTVTRQINGGHNGIEERRKYFAEYKSNPSLLAAAIKSAPQAAESVAETSASDMTKHLAELGLKPTDKIATATIKKPDGTTVKLSDVAKELLPKMQEAGVDTKKLTNPNATAEEFYLASQELSQDLRKKKQQESTVTSAQTQSENPMEDMMKSMGGNPLIMVLALVAVALKDQSVASAPPVSTPSTTPIQFDGSASSVSAPPITPALAQAASRSVTG